MSGRDSKGDQFLSCEEESPEERETVEYNVFSRFYRTAFPSREIKA
jgi:hypothetical protein